MIVRLAAAAILSTALMHGAALGEGTSGTAQSKGLTAGQTAQSLPTQIEQKLKDQGFTNVQVVPGSYLVSAKDRQGDPVTMVIGPHSMTVFTVSTSGSGSTVGSGSQTGGSQINQNKTDQNK